jgi:hypothetical protein
VLDIELHPAGVGRLGQTSIKSEERLRVAEAQVGEQRSSRIHRHAHGLESVKGVEQVLPAR